MAAERIVSVRLQAKVDGFTSGMRKAKAAVDDLTKADVQKPQRAFSDLADKAALMGVAVGAGIGVAVKRFADFDAAMSAVKANSGATGTQLDSLRAAAIQLGADSQFSATEAAQGINELAKAGVKTQDILNGGLKGALDLAAAGQIEVGQAAETAASALTQFGLSGDKTAHVADLLTNGANKAQGGVLDLGQALNQAGLVANATGLTIEETTAGLTAFANAGLIGSDAGTSFKTMLQRLSAPSKESAELMAELGINAYDSQGQFVGLANVAGQLQSSLGNLTPEQRNSALATIFGADAVRAANVLYKEGAAGIQEWTAQVSEQGAAAKQAATLTDNLKGDVERLGGALDSVFIQTGSAANNGLRTIVQGLTGLVETVAKIPGPVLLAAGGLATLAFTVPKGIVKFREFSSAVDLVTESLGEMAGGSDAASDAVEALGESVKVVGLLGTALASAGVFEQFFGPDTTRPAAEGLTRDLLMAQDAVASYSAKLEEFADESSNWWASNNVTSYGDAVNDVFSPSTFQNIDNFAGRITEVFGISNNSDIANATAAIEDLDGVLAGLVQGGNGAQASELFSQFARAAEAQGVSVEQLKSKLPQYTEALAGADNQQQNAASSADLLTQANEATAEATAEAKKQTDDYVKSLQNAGLLVLDVRSAQRGFKESVVEASKSVKENGKTLDINTEKGRKNQAALDDVAKSALDLADAVYQNTGSEEKYRASLSQSRDSLIKTAQRFGLTKAEAKRYADQILKIPPAKKTTVTIRTVGIPDLKRAQDYLAGIRDKRVTLTVGTVKVGNTKVNAGQFADGGAIYGPGTGTSDSVPAMLSNGEHVLTAAEVRKAGGQDAIYRMRAEIARGALKFAQGGAVQSAMVPRFADGGSVQRFAPPVQYVRSLPSSTSGSGATYAPTFVAQGLDAQAAIDKAMRRYEYEVVSRL